MKKMYRCVDDNTIVSGLLNIYDYRCVVKIWFIEKETEHTYLLRDTKSGLHYKKRMYKNSKKRFAFETKEEAVNSYIRRKERQLDIYNNKTKEAKGIILFAEYLIQKED